MENQLQQEEFITSREAAKLLGVSLRSVQLWVESGILRAWKTAGGHRRIAKSSVQHLLQKQLSAGSSTKADKQYHRNNPLNVVVVEDEAVQLALYKIKFEEWGLPINLLTISDAYEALLKIGTNKPDVVITDLNMPGMDGFRMIRTLVSNPELKAMDILAITALSAEEIAEQGGLPESVAVLNKPVPFNIIEMFLKELISVKPS